MPDERRLTIQDLAARTGEPEEELRRWQSLGLLGGAPGSAFDERDVNRARLVRFVLDRGISVEDLARMAQREASLLDEIERTFPAGPAYTIEEACRRAGLDPETARRFWRAGDLGDEAWLVEDDVRVLRGIERLLSSGFPEDALLQVFRVYADTLDRAAEAGMRAFHFYVHQPARSGGGREGADIGRLASATDRMLEPTILYFFRKASAKAGREDLVMHVMEDAGLVARHDAAGGPVH